MGRSVLAATLVVIALLTLQLPAGVYVQNVCVNHLLFLILEEDVKMDVNSDIS